jgi:hypothetical protein
MPSLQVVERVVERVHGVAKPAGGLIGVFSGTDRFLNTASCEDRRRPAIPTMAQRWAARVAAMPSRVMLAAGDEQGA